MSFRDFQPEIDALKADGYEIVQKVQWDYGRSLALYVRKGGKDSTISLVECYYDTDDQGNRTKWHGVVDIRNTPWSKGLRAI